MSIVLTCPSCSKRSRIADRPPGSAVRCPHCANVMRVPGAIPTAKVAAVAPSVSDAPVAAPGAAAVPDVPPLLPEISSAYTCASCGGSFPADQVYDQSGQIICHGCYAMAHQPQPSALTPFVPADAAETRDSAEAHDTHAAHLPSEDSEVGAAADADDSHWHETASAPSTSRPRAPRKTGPPGWLWPTVIGGAVALVAIGGGIYYSVLHNQNPAPVASNAQPSADSSDAHDVIGGPDQQMTEWEKRNGPRLAEWRSEARSLEVSGDLIEAQLRYQKMIALSKTATSPPVNPGIVQELAEANTHLGQINAKIGPPRTLLAFNAAGQMFTATAPKPSAATTTATSKPSVDSALEIPTGPETVAMAPDDPSHPSVRPAAPIDPAQWEAEHKAGLLKLAADAASAQSANHPITALAKLLQLRLTVGEHLADLKDPELKQKVADAETLRKKLTPSAKDNAEASAITSRSLLQMGLAAEANKKWKTGYDALSDASVLMAESFKASDRYRDPWYLAAQNGMAISLVVQQKLPKAGEMFADDEPIGRATLANSNPSRALVWNRAVFDINQKTTILRSVKMLADYVQAHPGHDEPLLNLFGTALFIADESNPPNRKVLDEAIGLYGQRSLDLEKDKPGQRRWGIQWMQEADAQEKFDAYNKAIDAYQEAMKKKQAAEAHAKEVQESVKDHQATAADLKTAKAAVEETTKALKAAHDAIPRAPWLTDALPIVPKFEEIGVAEAGAGVTAPPLPPGPPAPPPPPPPPGSKVFPPDPNLPKEPAPDANQTPAAPSAPAAADVTPIPLPQDRHAMAFPVDKLHLVSSADAVGSAQTVQLQGADGQFVPAKVVGHSDHLVLLEVASTDIPGGSLSPFGVAASFEAGPVQCVGVPRANLFAPQIKLIAAEDAPPPVRTIWSIALAEHPRLAGGPLLNASSQVIGIEMAQREDSRKKLSAVTLSELQQFLQANRISASPSAKSDPASVWEVWSAAE